MPIFLSFTFFAYNLIWLFSLQSVVDMSHFSTAKRGKIVLQRVLLPWPMLFNERHMTSYRFYGIEERKTILSLRIPDRIICSGRKENKNVENASKRSSTIGAQSKHLIKTVIVFSTPPTFDGNTIASLITKFGSNKNWCVSDLLAVAIKDGWKESSLYQRASRASHLHSTYIQWHLYENQCKFEAINLHTEWGKTTKSKIFLNSFLKIIFVDIGTVLSVKKCMCEWCDWILKNTVKTATNGLENCEYWIHFTRIRWLPFHWCSKHLYHHRQLIGIWPHQIFTFHKTSNIRRMALNIFGK